MVCHFPYTAQNSIQSDFSAIMSYLYCIVCRKSSNNKPFMLMLQFMTSIKQITIPPDSKPVNPLSS